ncbi:transposase [Streptomyces sp. NBC_00328]
MGAALARQAKEAGVVLRAVAADCAYGDQDGFRRELADAGLPFVMAIKPRHGAWAYGDQAYTPVDAARALAWHDPDEPGDWSAVTRTFRDGHTTTWWAADAHLGWWGPDGNVRLVVATTDQATLPAQSTWYLATRPAQARRTTCGREPDPAGRPDRDRADLRSPGLDRAELQTSQGRTRMGRLPGSLRQRHPPSPDPRHLRVLLLLGHLVRPTSTR